LSVETKRQSGQMVILWLKVLNMNNKLAQIIVANMTPDVLMVAHPETYQLRLDKGIKDNPVWGLCYVASVLYMVLAPPHEKDWLNLYRIEPENWPEYGAHYFIRNTATGEIIDLTRIQFPTDVRPPYEKARWAEANFFIKYKCEYDAQAKLKPLAEKIISQMDPELQQQRLVKSLTLDRFFA
jgi:hypothetical protein